MLGKGIYYTHKHKHNEFCCLIMLKSLQSSRDWQALLAEALKSPWP